jgi:hypothetical protein
MVRGNWKLVKEKEVSEPGLKKGLTQSVINRPGAIRIF